MTAGPKHTITLSGEQLTTIIKALERQQTAIPYRSDLFQQEARDLDRRLSDVLFLLLQSAGSEEEA